MVSKKILIRNESGLHARPASILAKESSLCPCNVLINTGTRTVVAKSVLNIMSAIIKKGTEIELICDGEDEVASLEKLSALIEEGFGEL